MDSKLKTYRLGQIADQELSTYLVSFRIDPAPFTVAVLDVTATGALAVADATQAIIDKLSYETRDNYFDHLNALYEELQGLAHCVDTYMRDKLGENWLRGADETTVQAIEAFGKMSLELQNQIAMAGWDRHGRNRAHPRPATPQQCVARGAPLIPRFRNVVDATCDLFRLHIDVAPQPPGRLAFEPRTGVFTYEQAGGDDAPFTVTFSALAEGKRVRQAVKITPMPRAEAARDVPDQAITKFAQARAADRPYSVGSPAQGKKDTVHVVSGLDVTLDASMFEGPWTDVDVYAHIVRIPKPLKAPRDAVNVRVCARCVVFDEGAALDVSGAPGKPPLVETAQGGAKDGEPGHDGDPGNRGGAAGHIEIVAERIVGTATLIANGGAGGKGQNGGPGAQGAQGPNGTPPSHVIKTTPWWAGGSNYTELVPGTAGGKGCKGASGGNAGQRGDHADGGSIKVCTVKPHNVEAKALAGQSCLSATDTGAKPGEGGPGGAGGIGERESTVIGSPRKPNGGQGDPGDRGKEAPSGKAGAPGVVERRLIGYDALVARFAGQPEHAGFGVADARLLPTVVHAVERLHLNAASERDLVTVRSVAAYLAALHGQGGNATDTWWPRIARMRGNLDRGLDFFGQPCNFVFGLSFAANERFHDKFKGIAKDLESDYDRFWDKDASDNDRRASLERQLDRAEQLAERLQGQADALFAEAGSNQTLINELTQKAIEKKAVVAAKLAEFKDEQRTKQQLDILRGVVDIAWSFVPIGTNVKPMLSNGLTLVKEFMADKPSSAAPGTEAVLEPGAADQAPTGVSKGDAGTAPPSPKDLAIAAFGKVRGGAEAIYKDYNQYFRPKAVPDDLLKLGLDDKDQAAFDKEVDEFVGSGAAQALKDETHAYLELTRQRNTLVLKREADIKQGKDLLDRIKDLDAMNREMRGRVSMSYDPQAPTILTYMAQTTDAMKMLMTKTLYMMSRSVEYYTLSRDPLQIDDFRVATLEAQYGQLLALLQANLTESGPRTPERFRVATIADRASLAQLAAGEPIWITLALNTNDPPTGPFARKFRPRVLRVECYLNGASASAPDTTATVAIENAGTSLAYNETTHDRWSFTHARRTVPFEYDLRSGVAAAEAGDLTQAGQFFPLSPFGTWGVQVRKEEGRNDRIDLSNLASVDLWFTAASSEAPIRQAVGQRETAEVS
jgi:hypothetical protein